MKENILEQKSFEFELEIIRLYCKLREKQEYVISKQLLRSGTSIGANVEEAIAGQSRSDFLSKLSIARKEARETRYWLRLLQASELAKVDVTHELAEAEQIPRLLTSIIKTTQHSANSTRNS